MLRIIIFTSFLIPMAACNGEASIDPSVEQLGRASGPVSEKPSGPVTRKPQTAQPSTPRAMPPLHEPSGMMPPAKGSAPAVVIKGEVLETIDVTRYTYIRLQHNGEELWAAVPKTPLEVGKPVEIVQSVVMKDFESKTLKRTFPSIVFGVLGGADVP